MSNPFAKVKTTDELLGQVIGAGSMCWKGEVYDAGRAKWVLENAQERLNELMAKAIAEELVK